MQITETFKNIFKIKDLRDRILLTLGLLIVFRLGAHIPLPGINISAIAAFEQQGAMGLGNLFELMQIFSGGAFGAVAIFTLGIMPYITASIIMSLLAKVNPTLEAIAKEGQSGQRKINQYTRLLTVPVALIQSIMAVASMRGRIFGGITLIPAEAGFFTTLEMVLALTAGSVFLMWLGEQITEHGIGNGASILIMSGILARLPTLGKRLFDEVHRGTVGMDAVIIIFLLYVGVIIAIVFITQSQRRIPVRHARMWRGQRMTMGQRNYLPLKVNQAGVMPVIFASSLLIIPTLLGLIPGLGFIKNAFARQTFIFTTFYIGMIFFFSYFWTFLFFPPDEMANNLKEYGSFIPGIRPGHNTSEYLDKILKRITLFGAAFLCVIALLPDMAAGGLSLPRFELAFLGGTGILIVVGVCQDIIQKIESYLIMHNYAGFMGEGSSLMRSRR